MGQGPENAAGEPQTTCCPLETPETAVEKLQRTIEEALTLRRPCCGAAVVFGLWDGCPNVRCDCGALFCGVCLSYYYNGNRVQEHRQDCGAVIAGPVVISNAHSALACERLRAALRAFRGQPELVAQALVACERELKDVGLSSAVMS